MRLRALGENCGMTDKLEDKILNKLVKRSSYKNLYYTIK